MAAREVPYGYRDDPSVPAFPDDKPIIVFDGYCALCSGWVRFVIRHDPRGIHRFVAAQSPLGQALYAHYGFDTTEFETNLLVRDGLHYAKMDGSIRMAAALGFPWSLANAMRVLPRFAQDALYDLIARNRFRLFGRTEVCHRPDPAHADRFIT